MWPVHKGALTDWYDRISTIRNSNSFCFLNEICCNRIIRNLAGFPSATILSKKTVCCALIIIRLTTRLAEAHSLATFLMCGLFRSGNVKWRKKKLVILFINGWRNKTNEVNKAEYTAQDAPGMRTFHLRK